MKLLNSQKNILFDILQYFDLPPSQFAIQEVKSRFSNEICTDLAYINSEFYFSFETNPSSKNEPYYCIYSPGPATFESEVFSRSWEGTIMEFNQWASSLKREISVVNKWDRLNLEMSNLKFSFTESDNNKFNVSEYAELAEKIKLLKNGVLKLDLPLEQLNTFNDKLDHLTNLAKEMNKYDWKNLFIGTTISIIIQLSVSQENAKNIFNLIKSIFNNYLLP